MINSTRTAFPLLRLQGSPSEIGFQHGSLLRERIRGCFDLYRSLISRFSDDDVRRFAATFRQSIAAFHPPFAEEIDAIAEGAGLEPWKIYLLNARTEILRALITQGALPPECSALFFRQRRILGQNWDWAPTCEELVVFLQIRYSGDKELLTFTEPGILAKIGMNSDGVGVCLNILRAPAAPRGVPVHILLRAVLESSSAGEAKSRVLSADLGTMSNLIIADATGEGLGIEIAGGAVGVYGSSASWIAHTNHYLTLDVDNPRAEHESSYARQEALEARCARLQEGSLGEMKEILGDRSNARLPICCEYEPDDLVVEAGTVTTIVMDLPHRELHYTPGNPLRHGFEQLRLS